MTSDPARAADARERTSRSAADRYEGKRGRHTSTIGRIVPQTLPIILLVLATLYPAASLNIPGAANGGLFLFSLIGLFSLPMLVSKDIGSLTRPSLLHIAILGCLPFTAAVASELARGQWVPRNLDLPLRFALLGPCMACACRLGAKHVRHLQWGLIAGAIAGGSREIYLNYGVDRVAQIGLINTIPYSDIALMFGFLSLLTLGWTLADQRRPWLVFVENTLKLLAFALALGGSIASGSRGGWLTIPFLGLLCWYALAALGSRDAEHQGGSGTHASSTYARVQRAGLAAAILALIALGVWHAWPRLTEAFSNIAVFLHYDHFDTPVGIRFEVWHASVMMFAAHPLFGIGTDQFIPVLNEMVHARRVPDVLLGLPHSHNDMLFALSTAGAFGGLGLLCLYLVPFATCLRWLLDARFRQVRCVMAMGVVTPLSYLIFGLTETMFIISMETAIFVFMTAVFLAVARTTMTATLEKIAHSGSDREGRFTAVQAYHDSDAAHDAGAVESSRHPR
ncbi:hypothetical protein WM40_11370 [Robbsia andropogonis]|uniref:O-antigen ligase-related domain-containing protein n=3 Tax=Robbsia andropogonis TaxID=28092 RepID=A0A0F5K0H5_9BURK|nr:O-antigen ligase family protein [Robbsia andropogonis]KKB63578.1 hypothetical protein WM40_11370 [Robbsia andropogonis]MCP1116758.1 O-antigen ligase family protein [Robbsia andropogonis]MCP1126563.1 O-antigen ligase family protein [Robbsia andropogonis]